MKRLLIAGFLWFCAVSVYGQVNVEFNPDLNGKSIDGLFNVRIINSGPVSAARLYVMIRENNQQVVHIKTPVFNLGNGMNILPPSVVKGSIIQFGNTNSGQFISHNNFFPYGTFEYCYTIESAEFGSWEECMHYEVMPTAPMMLTAPYDGDHLCETRPVFMWQPSIPILPGTAYQLVLTAVKEGQNIAEALNYNLPLVNQDRLTNPVLPLPSIVPQLEKGQKYAWQVTAYKGRTILNRSEIWTFTVGCEEEEEEDDVNLMSYRVIEDLKEGNFEIIKRELKFSFNNLYAERELIYQITPLYDTNRKVGKLPSVILKKGLNFINIDLSDKALKEGKDYLLTLDLGNGIIKKMRFQYENDK